jgi:hypothetical protein
MSDRTARLAVLVLLLGGCYTYVPADLGEVGPEQDVRLRLAPAEASRLDGFANEGERAIDGRVLAHEGDSVLVRVEAHSELRGVRVETLYQRVNVARPAVLDVELRELDKTKTYLLTGAAAAAIAALAANRLSSGGSRDPNGGGDPNETLIPIFSVPLSLLALFGR